MDDYQKELGVDPSWDNKQTQKHIDKERKKWTMRLNAPDLTKRQEAERKLKLLDQCEESLNGTQPKKDPPKKEPKSEPKQEQNNTSDIVASTTRKVEHFIETKNFDGAFELLRSVLKQGNDNWELHALEGDLFHYTECDEQGYFKYKTAHRAQPSTVLQAKLLLTGALSERTDLEPLTKDLDESVISQVALGEYALTLHNHKLAFTHADTALEQDSTDVDALILMLKAMSGMGLPPEQFDLIGKRIRKLPENDRLIKTQLQVLFKQRQFRKCEQICKKVRMNNPNSTLAKYAEELVRKMNAQARAGGSPDSPNPADHPHIKTANVEEALAQLDHLTGLTVVKEQLEKLRKKVQYDKQRQEKLGLSESEDDSSYHFVFSGNPGTGKTTVARLFSEVFFHLGILSKGHLIETDRAGLVGQYIGETSTKTTKILKDAMGGVLFIDEAYALASGGETDFGKEAIDILVKGVEDNRNDLIVILAGYKDDMRTLMDTNTGLASRFTKYIDFEDYTKEELLEIAVNLAQKQNYTLDEGGKRAFTQQIEKQMLGSKFGNARAVRNLMNEAFEEKANTNHLDEMTMEELTTLTALDFGVDESETPEARAEKYLNELQSLIGLDSVKTDIENLIGLISFQKEEQERIGAAVAPINMHMVFAGNPGTGKTTVARLYGNLLREIGILKQGQFVEASRADLVGRYLGHTAPLVKAKCEEAFGGILFIDEAYALCNDERDSFGLEAVNILIKEMEDHREKLVVILAGYTGNMEEFLLSNPGFASRITKTLVFQDYTPDQLWEIFELYAAGELITYEPECEEIVKKHLEKLLKTAGANFGNARDVRKLFEAAKMAMIMRVTREKITGDDRRKILPVDIK
ncbi:MAG: AAA family ATPase [Eubacteriales bacterium]